MPIPIGELGNVIAPLGDGEEFQRRNGFPHASVNINAARIHIPPLVSH